MRFKIKRKLLGILTGLMLSAAGVGTALAASGGVQAVAGVAQAVTSGAQTAETAQAAETAPAVSASGTITSCTIGADKSSVSIQFTSSENGGNADEAGMNGGSGAETNGGSADGQVYVFELQPYEDSVGDRTDYAARAVLGQEASVSLPLNLGTAQDRLYSRFALAVYDGREYRQISSPHYITNPEVVAPNQEAFKDPLTKKGLNIEINMLEDAFDLGVKHVATNIAFSQIMGTGIEYEYDGTVYHFNKAVVDDYDATISALSNKGMTVTAIILNDWNPNTPDLIYPGTAKSSDAYYYMFNGASEAGFKQTRAIASFLAEHYDGSDSSHGKISNWIIGNEINCQVWNYMGPTDLTNYVRAYQKAFRIFYTAIKSTSANDRVYFSLAYWWGLPYENQDNGLNYKGKDIVDSFNSIANTEGQMDWGLAYHPYPHPLAEPEFWDDADTGLVTRQYDSPVINFANLDVLTDYFSQETLKAPSGQVRNIILTEQGFTSYSPTRGDVPEIQAAAYAYSYYLVDSNPHIDAYILSRQVDAPAEVNTGLKFGMWECDMSKPNLIVATKRKKLWQVFRDIDKKNVTLEASEFAKPILGIEKWSDLIPNFRWKNLEN